MVRKVCIICGEEFSDRPVFHTCPQCREEFIDNINKMFEEVLSDNSGS